MKNMISIGRFSKLTNLTIRTLRLYDELDVLTPGFVDPDTNYRFYRLDQVPTAQQIRALRDTGLSLPNIRMILQKPHDAIEQLKVHRGKMLSKVEAMESNLDVLDEMFAA
jgi:DNA-binding transcriptional MerR regulator